MTGTVAWPNTPPAMQRSKTSRNHDQTDPKRRKIAINLTSILAHIYFALSIPKTGVTLPAKLQSYWMKCFRFSHSLSRANHWPAATTWPPTRGNRRSRWPSRLINLEQRMKRMIGWWDPMRSRRRPSPQHSDSWIYGLRASSTKVTYIKMWDRTLSLNLKPEAETLW